MIGAERNVALWHPIIGGRDRVCKRTNRASIYRSTVCFGLFWADEESSVRKAPSIGCGALAEIFLSKRE